MFPNAILKRDNNYNFNYNYNKWQVKSVTENPDLIQSLDLVDLLSGLDMSEDKNDMRMVSYDELYPQHWARNTKAEQRHRDIVTRITNWPKTGENEVRF